MSAPSPFRLVAPFKPTGDQPEAIETLVAGLAEGLRFQTLEGVTGSGKTFTLANVIARFGKPALVISHNKTLAAQLFRELKDFFPENAVEYFVSYYDYYQPEAYIPQTDTYIEKDASINEEIERLRLSATNSLLNRDDVVIVASVSCIYGLGSPEDYGRMLVKLEREQTADRDSVLNQLVAIQYSRNDYEPAPGCFRVRGDTIDIFPSYSRRGVRVVFFGDVVERIMDFDPVTGHVGGEMEQTVISPAKHFVLPKDSISAAIELIQAELDERVAWFLSQGKDLEAQRLRQRTLYDIEMLREVGYCAGIENYSRHLSGRAEGEPPATLLSYFPGEFLTIVDESHASIPQLRAMYNGDRSRKQTLVDHGFRLPSALDNRPLKFEEFLESVGQVIFASATPGPFEKEVSQRWARQWLRPTGLLDPPVEVRTTSHPIDDLAEEIRARAERGERVLVTTLTKRSSEDLSDYLREMGLRVEYLHSEIEALERVEILRRLRLRDYDCLVGINLLREGLDLPEVSLVAILDADKEGFLRSETSLLQIAGRTARNVNGKVILYATAVTEAMRRMIQVTEERRKLQESYNREHGITPRTITKAIQEGLARRDETEDFVKRIVVKETGDDFDVFKAIGELEREMMEAADALEFERAAALRDQILEIRKNFGLDAKEISGRRMRERQGEEASGGIRSRQKRGTVSDYEQKGGKRHVRR